MENLRTINKVVTGKNQVDGAGVKLVRVFGYNDVKDFDPFLMLDGFDSNNFQDYIKGFPWHPHRGIETVTYLIEGKIEHGDSLGNEGVIYSGDCQWMTAGSGIIHQEMPQPSERMLGVQLWLNLPKKDKMTQPEYRDITADQIPVLEEEGSTVRIISGEYKKTEGAIQGDYVKTLFLHIDIDSNKEWSINISKDNTVFIYIVEGECSFDKDNNFIDEKSAVLLNYDSEKLYIKAGEKGARVLVLSAKPLNEPIAWGGPIVMNTKEELKQAFKEIDEGTFIKK
ncbi:hypothetical protein EDC18_103137 [Natranaerovirga pectinivora]|uniref:Pirin N-terminal domain-containing protein n=1 Tax=Natranaerovirga pectinivora TaxID=682400 RepID=A0A4R3ML70_9FIRM|nr:pirin family protein [Natranaerovirga pectinivora]TCT15432.1 hypothetical protein EDC18_103137 [Natranaerovirga pectinivora]